MPSATYTALANITLGSSAASVTFSSINQGFRDLVLVANGNQNPTANADFGLLFNSATTGYQMVDMMGNGTTTESQAETNTYADCGTYLYDPSGVKPIVVVVNLMDYSVTDKHKAWLARNSSAAERVWAVAGRYASTSAITSITVKPSGGLLASGMTLALYGITA